MNKWLYKLYRFMYGRYGIDELYKLLLILCIILSVINIFMNNKVISIIESMLLVIAIYRSMSRNKIKRKYENSKYLKIKGSIKGRFVLIKRRWRDRDTYIYKRCSKCRTVLRLPLRKGVHTCKCPSCGNKFDVKCRRNEKVQVEVIRNR